MCIYIYICIYIYRERERDRSVCVHIYIYIYVYMYIIFLSLSLSLPNTKKHVTYTVIVLFRTSGQSSVDRGAEARVRTRCNVVSCYVVLRHVALCKCCANVMHMLCHVVLCHAMSCYVVLCHVASCFVMRRDVMWRDVRPLPDHAWSARKESTEARVPCRERFGGGLPLAGGEEIHPSKVREPAGVTYMYVYIYI